MHSVNHEVHIRIYAGYNVKLNIINTHLSRIRVRMRTGATTARRTTVEKQTDKHSLFIIKKVVID